MSEAKRTQSGGFSLVELMICVAIIGAIASMTIPSLVRTRIAGNEASVVSTLRSLVTLQATWRQGDFDRNRVADYWTGDVSGFYRVERMPAGSGVPIGMIDVAVAMADDARVGGGAAVVGAGLPGTTVNKAGLIPLTRAAAKAGHLFRAILRDGAGAALALDVDGTGQAFHNTVQFAFQARPEVYDSGGINTMIVSAEGVIYARDFGNSAAANAEQWPGPNPTAAMGWRPVQ